jgi:uncharacterized protein (DUF2062 family)
VLGESAVTETEALLVLGSAQVTTEAPEAKLSWKQRIAKGILHLRNVGKPLAVGLLIVATLSGLTVYFLISGVWVLKTRWERKRRLRERTSSGS